MTRRLAVAALLVAGALVPAGAASASPPMPGGRCDGVVDTGCRDWDCDPDELDCGLVPPCMLWVAPLGCVVR